MRELFKNCIRIEEEGDWLRPVRLTEAQEKSCMRREPLYLRAVASAGISIAFRSAAERVTIEYKIKSNVRDYAFFDIVVDGALRKTENLIAETDTVILEIPGRGEREVEIFLPHLAQVWFRRIEPNAPYTKIPQKEKLWLFLGDSITQGMHSKHPALSYPVLSAQRMGCDFINMGVCGATFYADDIDAPERKPDFITVAFGCNDWKQAKDKESFRENARTFLERLTNVFTCRNICGILPIWRSDEENVYGQMTFEEMHGVLRSEYERYPFVGVLDGRKLVPPMEEFYGDGAPLFVHPNETGFLYYSMRLTEMEEVREALAK